MNKSLNFRIAAQIQQNCACPTLGEMLPDYVVELLEDSAAAEVEDHLLDCLHCREKYLKMLTLNGACSQAKVEINTQAGSAQPGTQVFGHAKVIRIADFKKRHL